MDPFTLALLAGAGAKGIGAITQGVSQFAQGRDLRLTDAQKKRMKELERIEALGEFGLTPAQREAYYAQAMTPVQTAERQALAQFGASQAIGDIGQGAAFRQQQAIKQGSEESRAKVAQAVAEKEAQAADAQQQQLAALRAQEQKARQLQRDAALGALGGLAQAAGEAAGAKAEQLAVESLYNKKLAQLTGAQEATVKGAQQMLGIEAMDTEEQDKYARELSKLISPFDDGEAIPMNKDLKDMLSGETMGETMGLIPNSQLTPEQRLEQLPTNATNAVGEPQVTPSIYKADGTVDVTPFLSERATPEEIARINEFMNLEEQPRQSIDYSKQFLVNIPNTNLQGYNAGWGFLVPHYGSGGQLIKIDAYNSKGKYAKLYDFAELQGTSAGRDEWNKIRAEMRAAMGEEP